MNPEFWMKRWHDGATGFHMTRVTPLLAKHWPTVGLEPSARVLVPLCGKSLDMVWLAGQGHSVLGVELVPAAVEQFFDEQRLEPAIHESPAGRHYVAGPIEIICGDIFGLDAGTLAACTGVYDRGALVALPADMRRRYARHVYGGLACGYRGLVLTLEYEQSLMEGPPFSIPAAEMHALFAERAQVSELGRLDIIDKETQFAERGLNRLDSVTWMLRGMPRDHP